MSLSNLILKGMGLVFAFVGFFLILGAVGVSLFGIALSAGHPLLSIIIGICFMYGGYVLIKGGVITL